MKLYASLLSLILALFASLPASATNYYLSSARGDDSRSPAQAQSSATPWKTLDKINGYFINLKAGDSILLERGNVFMGKIVVTKSGSSGAPIAFGAFGSGSDPIITGFATVWSWASVGSNIWQAPCQNCGSRVNMMAVGGVPQPMGRTPNAQSINKGYDTVQSHSGTGSITNTKLGSGPNWTGADVVIRKYRWVMERDSITSHSGSTINFVSGSTFQPTNKFGYFIQNHVQTLDQPGEWYYDPKTKMVKIYWAGTTPTFRYMASVIDTLVTIKKFQYFSFTGIMFEGSNQAAFSFLDASNISITNCKIRYSGRDGIEAIRTNFLTITNALVDYTNNNAIDLDGSNNVVQDSKILRTGTIPGMGGAIDSYQGITIHGSNNTIQYNTIDSTGYNPVVVRGTYNTIRNNKVDYFCYVKDDGGGIYTWSGDTDSSVVKVGGSITGNIVLNGQTVPEGTDRLVAGIAHGIYLDENSQQINLSGNTVANCTAGLFIQDSHELTVTGNTLYNNNAQIILRKAQPTGTLKNNDISGNIGVTRTDSQYNVYISSIASSSGIWRFANFRLNKYASVSKYSIFLHTALSDQNVNGSFGLWKTQYYQDLNSSFLALNYSPYTVNQLIGSNKYTSGDLITQFQQTPPGSRTVINKSVGAILSNTWYVANFSFHSPDDAHTLVVYLQKYLSPYTVFTQVVNIPSVSPVTIQSVIFNTNGADPNGAILFLVNNSDTRMYIDKISLYQANVTPNDISQNVFFQYNASKIAKTVSLGATYQDVSGVTYQSSVQIQPYSSVILFKK